MEYSPQILYTLPLTGKETDVLVYAKQGDYNSRFVNVQLQNWDGVTVQIPEQTDAYGLTVSARAKVSTGYSYPCTCEVQSNRRTIKIGLPRQALANPGLVIIDVILTEGRLEGASFLSSSTFKVRVTPSAETTGMEPRTKMQMIQMSTAEFEAMAVHDANTVYYVIDPEGNVKQYLGDVEMAAKGEGASLPVGTAYAWSEGVAVTPIVGTASESTDEAETTEGEVTE